MEFTQPPLLDDLLLGQMRTDVTYERSPQAALNDPFRQCEKCGELVEFTDYQVHVERHTLAMKQCCGLTFRDAAAMQCCGSLYN